MASAWGNAWGLSWGSSWGAAEAAEDVTANLDVTEDDDVLSSTARVRRRGGRVLYVPMPLPPIIADLNVTEDDDTAGPTWEEELEQDDLTVLMMAMSVPGLGPNVSSP